MVLNKSENITIKEAASFLGVSRKTLRRWEVSGKLVPDRTSGGHRRYLLSKLISLKEEKQTPDKITFQFSPKPPTSTVNTLPKTKQTKTFNNRIAIPTFIILFTVASLLLLYSYNALPQRFIKNLDTLRGNINTRNNFLQKRIDHLGNNSKQVLSSHTSLDSSTFNLNVQGNFNEDIVLDENLSFVGSSYLTTVKIEDPSIDRTITFPDASGEVCLSTDTCRFS
jgi:excisionase family DNA binding protein